MSSSDPTSENATPVRNADCPRHTADHHLGSLFVRAQDHALVDDYPVEGQIGTRDGHLTFIAEIALATAEPA